MGAAPQDARVDVQVQNESDVDGASNKFSLDKTTETKVLSNGYIEVREQVQKTIEKTCPVTGNVTTTQIQKDSVTLMRADGTIISQDAKVDVQENVNVNNSGNQDNEEMN
jgi:hypothetical protein